jgi:CheY-like chemotaxis protein
MSVKTILVAHRSAEVRDRFAAAFADARHTFVMAATEAAARRAASDAEAAVDLSLVDLGLAEPEDPLELVRALATTADGRERPVVVFSGSIASAQQAKALAHARVAGFMNDHANAVQILPALARYLFPDNFNRRSTDRIPVEVPIALRAGDMIAGAVTVNVSKGGVAIRTINPVPVSSVLGLSFKLPGTADEIEATGRVAWTDRDLLMGVQFESIPESAERAIAALTAWVTS